jgi:hypothetical protein
MPIESDRIGPARGVSATGWAGVALGVAGAVLLFVGWWGVSGESLIALQLPYLASASIPGAALLIVGAILLAGEPARRSARESAQMIARLYDLLTEASLESPEAPPAIEARSATTPTAAIAGPEADATPPEPNAQVYERRSGLVALNGGTRYHRVGCALVEGKPGVTSVDPATIEALGLQPCPVCTPTLVES